ncbi:hypothetical protein BKA57DRAFT_502054 [Linnemannia elongata]|nr:hypothetical protein BKA57DRAFT_502054 [Linnemannia elongata]
MSLPEAADLQDPQSEGKIFERHAPLDLIFAFHKEQLKQVLFSIPKPAVRQSTTKLKTPIPQIEPVTFPRRFFRAPSSDRRMEGYEWGARYKETLTMGDFLEALYKHGSRRGDLTEIPMRSTYGHVSIISTPKRKPSFIYANWMQILDDLRQFDRLTTVILSTEVC